MSLDKFFIGATILNRTRGGIKLEEKIAKVIGVSIAIAEIVFTILLFGLSWLSFGIILVALFITNAVFWVVWDFIRPKTPEDFVKDAIKKEEKELALYHRKKQLKLLKEEIDRLKREIGEQD